MPVVLTINDTGRPRGELVRMAYEDCGLSEFGLTPDEIAKGVRKLDLMMGEWPWSLLGYEPGNDPGDLSGLDASTENAAVRNLAIELAPGLGVTLDPRYSAKAKQGLQQMCAAATSIPTASVPGGTVMGSGNRRMLPFAADPA